MTGKLFILVILMAMTFSACSFNKDAEVNKFVTEVNQLTTDIVRTVDEKPLAGVDQALTLLEARKNNLRADFAKLQSLRGFQLSKETAKKFTRAVENNVEAVAKLQIKYADKSSEDKNFGQKLNQLSLDFNSIFRG